MAAGTFPARSFHLTAVPQWATIKTDSCSLLSLPRAHLARLRTPRLTELVALTPLVLHPPDAKLGLLIAGEVSAPRGTECVDLSLGEESLGRALQSTGERIGFDVHWGSLSSVGF